MKELNPFEVLLVTQDLQSHGHTKWEMRPGNNCIWVTTGTNLNVHMYYIFKDGKIVDVQVD